MSDLKLRVSRPIISITAFTFIALVYVHQQIEMVKLSYVLDAKESRLEHILDRKEYLSYNIKELEDPSRLERILASRKIYTAFPGKGQIVSMTGAPSNAGVRGSVRTASAIEKRGIYFRIFEYLGLRAEAQATEK